jgi:hypothetical protein
MIGHIFNCQLITNVALFKYNFQVKSNQLMVCLIYESDEIGGILFALEISEISKIEGLLIDDALVVFIDVDPDWILTLNVFSNAVYSFIVDVGETIEGDSLGCG